MWITGPIQAASSLVGEQVKRVAARRGSGSGTDDGTNQGPVVCSVAVRTRRKGLADTQRDLLSPWTVAAATIRNEWSRACRPSNPRSGLTAAPASSQSLPATSCLAWESAVSPGTIREADSRPDEASGTDDANDGSQRSVEVRKKLFAPARRADVRSAISTDAL